MELDQPIATPHNRAAELALAVYRSVLAQLAPANLINRRCRLQGSVLYADTLHYDLADYANVYVAGAGKASAGLAQALMQLIGPWVGGGLVITKHGHGMDLGPVKVREASHPVPDRSSLAAGEAMLRFADSCKAGDLVIFILSGGASALMEVPEPDVDFLTIVEVTELMLASGASIYEINQVRNHLSQIKGGKLAAHFEPARVLCLVLSDVAGDSLSVIGSGPLWSDRPSGLALSKALAHRVAGLLSDQARRRLVDQIPLNSMTIPHVLLAGPRSLAVMVDLAAREQGLVTHCAPDLSGEAREEADLLTTQAIDTFKNPISRESPLLNENAVVYAVGEPVVKLRGKGRGGRCQEFAAAAAEVIRGQEDIAVLAGSTDGTDGPTHYAGGLVDGNSVARAEANGITVQQALDNNDSSAFLEACGGIIQTGPTQSNVTDLYLVVRA